MLRSVLLIDVEVGFLLMPMEGIALEVRGRVRDGFVRWVGVLFVERGGGGLLPFLIGFVGILGLGWIVARGIGDTTTGTRNTTGGMGHENVGGGARTMDHLGFRRGSTTRGNLFVTRLSSMSIR